MVLYNVFVLLWGLTITQNSIHTISDLDRSHLSDTRSAENASIGADTDPEYRIDASLVFTAYDCLNPPSRLAEFDLWPFRVNVIVVPLEISVSNTDRHLFPASQLCCFAGSDYGSIVSEVPLWCQSDLVVCHSHHRKALIYPPSHTVNFKGQEEEVFLDVNHSVIRVQYRLLSDICFQHKPFISIHLSVLSLYKKTA